MARYYLCIDLKTFYASVECVIRGLDPFTTNLVVADSTRGKGAICLAITPALKKLGIKNRCRIFEIPKNIKYIEAKPQMKLYMEYSLKIYKIYLEYVAKEDIHPYSIDEMFLDITEYLLLYNTTPILFAKRLLKEIYNRLGLVATAGIGTNLFLAKVALDITAKHSNDNIGYLDETRFKETLWYHEPLTDFWQIAKGTSNRLAKYNIFNMHDIAICDENILYKEFGVNAEILIDHANGIETVTIKHIKDYKTKNKSLNSSQILFSDYEYDKALLVLKEMVEISSLELIKRKEVTNRVSLIIGYSNENISATGGSKKLSVATNTFNMLISYFEEIFVKTTNKGEKIRRIGINFSNLLPEKYEYYDLFTDIKKVEREKKLAQTINEIKERYGKNSIIKGMDLLEGATTKERNKLIGGHNAENGIK